MKRRLNLRPIAGLVSLLLLAVTIGCGSAPAEDTASKETKPVSAESEPAEEHDSHAADIHSADGSSEGHGDEHDGDANHDDHGEANADDHDDHGDGHGHDSHSEGAHGGGHHNEFESAMHGNASPQTHPLNGQQNLAEWKTDLAIWSLVVFGLLSAILFKFAWGPISAALDEREQLVQANIDGAREQNEKAAALLADHEEKLAGTAEEIRQLLANAQKEAEAQKAGILAEAEASAEATKQRSIQEIEAAKNGALRELAEQSVDTAVGMAGSIVKRELKPDDHSSLISEAMKHFPGIN